MLETDLHQLIELFPGESDDDLYELTCAAFEEEPLGGPDHLPPDLDLVPPGTFLGAILSSIDLSRLSGDVVTVMKAHQRQIAHHQAGMYAAMSETAHCADPDTTSRTEVVNEFAPEEIGAALTLTCRMANRELAVALDAVRTLPAVHRALASGHIDARKATILTDHTAHLEDEARRRVIDQILGASPSESAGSTQPGMTDDSFIRKTVPTRRASMTRLMRFAQNLRRPPAREPSCQSPQKQPAGRWCWRG